jgi:hypothetical protein
MREVLLELTALNVEAAQAFERNGIQGLFFPLAKTFLREGRYTSGNKAVIWDYAYTAFWNDMTVIKDPLQLVSFLKSDSILQNDSYMAPSLLNNVIDVHASDRTYLELLLLHFGRFPSINKKISKLLGIK